jgi:stage II sporulation protein B
MENSGKTITIKINGEQKPFLEEPPKEEYKMEKPQSDENRNLLIEYDPENSEHEVIVETAAAQEAEESFDWILPQQETTQNEPSLYKTVKSSKQGKGIRLPALSKVEKKNIGTIKSIALSVVFAILLGTGFGFIMLKLVITNSSKPSAVQTKNVPAAQKETATTNMNAQGAITLNPLTTYMVQGGVFSKKETANTVARQAIEKGIPAETMEWKGQYYIFLGVADSIEHARSLGTLYQHKGMDGVFPKTVTIPEKKFSNLSAAEKDVIQNATVTAHLLATITSTTLSGGTISSSELKTLSELETKLKKIDSKAIRDKKINDLNVEINGALKQINDYQKKKDEKLLEKVQQHILTFFADYYSY